MKLNVFLISKLNDTVYEAVRAKSDNIILYC